MDGLRGRNGNNGFFSQFADFGGQALSGDGNVAAVEQGFGLFSGCRNIAGKGFIKIGFDIQSA